MSEVAEQEVVVDGDSDGRVLTEPEITAVLESLALHSGNSDGTAEDLLAEDIDISPATLRYWAYKKYPERYREARTKVAERVKEALADSHHSAAAKALSLEHEVMDLIQKKLLLMDGKELAAVLGKLGIGSGIHTEKGQLLDGEATARVERSPVEIQKSLANKGIKVTYDIDGEAEEEEDQPLLPAGD